MKLLDLTLPTLEENLALDEALLNDAHAGTGPEVLRLWEYPAPAVVLGSNGKVADDVDLAACREAGVVLGRRCSGGGTVVLARGSLEFSVILRYETAEPLRDLHASYRWILQRVAAAADPGAELRGSSDLTVAERKIGGNAQRRLGNALLHHGTLLYDFDMGLMRFLRMPPRRPEYRRDRPHAEFAVNLGLSREVLVRRLVEAWRPDGEVRDWPREAVAKLVEEKYGREEWVHRA